MQENNKGKQQEMNEWGGKANATNCAVSCSLKRLFISAKKKKYSSFGSTYYNHTHFLHLHILNMGTLNVRPRMSWAEWFYPFAGITDSASSVVIIAIPFRAAAMRQRTNGAERVRVSDREWASTEGILENTHFEVQTQFLKIKVIFNVVCCCVCSLCIKKKAAAAAGDGRWKTGSTKRIKLSVKVNITTFMFR